MPHVPTPRFIKLFRIIDLTGFIVLVRLTKAHTIRRVHETHGAHRLAVLIGL